MKKIRLVEHQKARDKVVYEAWDGDKLIYRSSPTSRRYVAIIISDLGNAVFRFGRLDLIGQGESSDHYKNHTYKYIAFTKDTEYFPIPPRSIQFSYGVQYGNNIVHVVAGSEDEAKSKAVRKLKRQYRVSTTPGKMQIVKTTTLKTEHEF